MINGNNQQQLRGVARVQGEIADDADLKTMVGNGYPVITISPEEGERYQGVVGLEGDTLAACTGRLFPAFRAAADAPYHPHRRS